MSSLTDRANQSSGEKMNREKDDNSKELVRLETLLRVTSRSVYGAFAGTMIGFLIAIINGTHFKSGLPGLFALIAVAVVLSVEFITWVYRRSLAK